MRLAARPFVFAIIHSLVLPCFFGCALPNHRAVLAETLGADSPDFAASAAIAADLAPMDMGSAAPAISGADWGMEQLAAQDAGAMRAGAVDTAASSSGGASGAVSLPTSPPGRQMIHTASLSLRVANREAAMRRLEEIAAAGGGPVYSQTLTEMTFGVPPAGFRAALDSIAGLGEVVSRSLSAEDVTDKFVDLRLRLDVAQKARQRLVALLEARGDIKEILEVERDIRRLTEEIEGIEGMLRSLNDRVAFSRITVQLSERAAPIATPLPPSRRGVGGILPWVDDSGVDAVLRNPPPAARLDGGRGRWGMHGPKFRLATEPDRAAPEGFLPILHDRETLLAATASDDRLRVRFVTMPESEAEIDFWTEAALHELRDYLGYRPRLADGNSGSTDSTDDSATGESSPPADARCIVELPMEREELVGRTMRFIAGERGREWLYDIFVVTAPGATDRLVVVEFAREKRATDPLLPTVEAAVRGLRSGALGR